MTYHFEWNQTFFTIRGIITNDNITLEEIGVLEYDPKETTEVFNNYHIKTVKSTFGKQPSAIVNPNSQCQDITTVKKIIEC